MGLVDFVKSAGQKLFGFGASAEEEAQLARKESRKRADALVNFVSGLGLPAEGLRVSVEGDVVVVEGRVESQEAREKIVLALGNTAGIGRVDDRLEVVTPKPEAVFYTVESGDTLSGIAKTQDGNAMKYPVIFEANRPMLSDPDKIYPGQVLRIPPLEG